MPPEIVVVPAAAFAVFFLGRLVLGPARGDDEPDPEGVARRFIDSRIDQHIERLTRAYAQPRAKGAHDDGFAGEIESFIGNVVLLDALTAIVDDDVSTAVRELVVLDRQYVYDQILTRVRDHLGAHAEAMRRD